MRQNICKNKNTIEFIDSKYVVFSDSILGRLDIEEVLQMFGHRRRYQMMGAMNSGEMRSMAKMAIAGFIVYQAAKYVVKEIMD